MIPYHRGVRQPMGLSGAAATPIARAVAGPTPRPRATEVLGGVDVGAQPRPAAQSARSPRNGGVAVRIPGRSGGRVPPRRRTTPRCRCRGDRRRSCGADPARRPSPPSVLGLQAGRSPCSATTFAVSRRTMASAARSAVFRGSRWPRVRIGVAPGRPDLGGAAAVGSGVTMSPTHGVTAAAALMVSRSMASTRFRGSPPKTPVPAVSWPRRATSPRSPRRCRRRERGVAWRRSCQCRCPCRSQRHPAADCSRRG